MLLPTKYIHAREYPETQFTVFSLSPRPFLLNLPSFSLNSLISFTSTSPVFLHVLSPEFSIVSDVLSSSDGNYIMMNNGWLCINMPQWRKHTHTESLGELVVRGFHTYLIKILRGLVIIITSPLCCSSYVSFLFSFILFQLLSPLLEIFRRDTHRHTVPSSTTYTFFILIGSCTFYACDHFSNAHKEQLDHIPTTQWGSLSHIHSTHTGNLHHLDLKLTVWMVAFPQVSCRLQSDLCG